MYHDPVYDLDDDEIDELPGPQDRAAWASIAKAIDCGEAETAILE